MSAGLEPLRMGYAGIFLLAAAGSAVVGLRAWRINHADTRRGLVGLLALSGGWALVQGVRLLVPPRGLKVALHVVGLILGLATVGAWLYFCSAYSGHSYHRNATYRRLAVGVYVVISGVKVTNPVHGLYVSVRPVAEPFWHLVIVPSTLHWTVAGLAYVLSAVGFYMLFQLFGETGYDTTRLAVLVGLAGLPAVATIAGYADIGPLVRMDYEPIGVAVFAIGTLYFAEDTFEAVHHHGRVQVLDELDEAVLLFDDDDRLRDYNAAARDLFEVSPAAEGSRLETLVPAVAAAIEESGEVIEREVGDGTRYFAVHDEPLTLGPHEVGRAVISTDVTELERQRRELARREDQLENLTKALTHELRNAVSIVRGNLELADEALEGHHSGTVEERVRKAQTTTDRMIRVINDLTTLAQHGGLVRETRACDLDEVVSDAREQIEPARLSVVVDGEGTVEADRHLLEKLFAQAFRFAAANGASEVRVRPTENGFAIEDDGDSIPDDWTDDLFEYGKAVPDAECGGILPTVRTLARVHGWSVSVDTDDQRGICYRVTGATADQSKIVA